MRKLNYHYRELRLRGFFDFACLSKHIHRFVAGKYFHLFINNTGIGHDGEDSSPTKRLEAQGEPRSDLSVARGEPRSDLSVVSNLHRDLIRHRDSASGDNFGDDFGGASGDNSGGTSGDSPRIQEVSSSDSQEGMNLFGKLISTRLLCRQFTRRGSLYRQFVSCGKMHTDSDDFPNKWCSIISQSNDRTW
jgi:hypothetical protein